MDRQQELVENLQKALLQLKLARTELERVKKKPAESIAIIGIGCRFPGGANHPQAFWDLLKQGYDGTIEVPPDRWDIDSFYDLDPKAPGKMYVRRGGFLNTCIDTFDANFFGISPREAEYMDPQQRLLLEVAWEALENACINPLSLKGTSAGVFIGSSAHDYSDLLYEFNLNDKDFYATTGNSASILVGRLSYFLELQGPALAFDTGCSSSIVAIDSACKSLLEGTSQLALAGGVNLILHPGLTISFCRAGALAPDGHCKSFDKAADGYVRSEGCGMIVLKRLSDALKDEDLILGIIRATQVNQNGATSGITVPNGEAQAALIRQALAHAKLEPNSIDYIEAHGTGTTLGDPIEVGALNSVFSGRKDHPLWLGTVKTNIGHLESASGIAGVVKVLLALNHEAIPPHLHFKNLNPRISLDEIPAKIPLSLTPWLRSSRPRIAGVSSFGYGGTNTHVIIEEPPIIERNKNAVERPLHLLTLSAKTQAALDQLIDHYTKWLPDEELADIAFTANTGRAHFPYRAAIVSQTREELLKQMQTGSYFMSHIKVKPPKIGFHFTGKNTNDSELFETSPVFKEAMERSMGLYEYALFELWKSWGITADYVLGDNRGDIIAAITAGIITLEDGLKLIASADHPEEQMKIAKGISYRNPQIGFISSWNGQILRQEGMTADYWRPHEPTKDTPHLPQDTIIISAQSNWKELLQTLSQLYLKGIQIDWKAYDKSYQRKKVSLPTYPFQRERYWIDALKTNKRRRLPTHAHPLLGEFIPSSSEDKLFKNELDLDLLPYLKDHQVFDQILFPGAGFVELMLAAGREIFKGQSFALNNLLIDQPLGLRIKKSTPIELLAKPKENNYVASIYSIEDHAWIHHAKGELSLFDLIPLSDMKWEALRQVCQTSVDPKELYHHFESLGLHYGRNFQTLREIWVGNRELIAELEGDNIAPLIDGSLQSLLILVTEVLGKENKSVFLPYSVDQIISFSELENSIRIHGKLTQLAEDSLTADFVLYSRKGHPLMKISGFHARKSDPTILKQMLEKQAGLGLSAWLYQIDWQPKPLEKLNEELKGPWVIVSETQEGIEGLQADIIKPEQASTKISQNPCAGILWMASGENSLKHALSFVQALSKLETKPALYFVTRGIQPIGPITDLQNSTFNGFYKTLKLEIPSLSCRHIDLASGDQFPIEELQAVDQEDQVAYTKGERFVPRLLPVAKDKEIDLSNRLQIDPQGSYLITGGFGSLGLKVAEWLVAQGAKHLVLVGRRVSKDPEIPHAIVEKIALDISQKPAVDAMMQKFGSEWPQLKGIIHAAGIIDDGILSFQDWSRFEKVFATKVQGSWNLHEASLTKPLDFFVLFSSFASILGSPGQINYASANAYMDALASFRHDHGYPAQSLSWGAWGEIGLAANFTERHRATGLIAFTPDEGIKALELALTLNSPHLAIANVDWRMFPYYSNFLSELIKSKVAEKPVLFQRLQDALPTERRGILIDYLQKIVGKILGTTSLDVELGFFEAGMDSLMTEELYEVLQAHIGSLHKFPPTLAFDHPSVFKLVAYFEQHVFPLIGIKPIVPRAAAQTQVSIVKEQIAIIGLSCRFPRGANHPQTFWNLLREGYDGTIEIPPDRWDVDAYYDPNPETPDKMYVQKAGFLNTSIDNFDANFFGITPREAQYVDPQQRLLLEVAWEALENACINPLSLKGSSTGVFIGISNYDYYNLISASGLEFNAYVGTGNGGSATAGRLSYFLDLQGPCMAVDTACSSSLVALNSAFKSLQNGECGLALAGGVNIILDPNLMILECKSNMLSKDGYCKTFDSGADGFVRGEGCGVVVLKTLSAALKDKDPVLGIIRATGVNHDGSTSGFTVPNKDAQIRLIRQTLENAQLEPDAIDYIETHGTGTPLGDPIEVGAIETLFKGRKEHPLWLGAVKTNIGHLEAAAGIAGVIKILLALNHEALPPNLHFKHLNPHISLDSIPAQIPLTLTPWQRSNRPRIAGISSFGFSGTNAHVVIEEAPHSLPPKKNAVERPWHILTLSAKTQTALEQLIDLYRKQLIEADLADIAFTANTGRAHFPIRAAFVAKTRDDLQNQLNTGDYLIGQIPAKLPKIAFLFTGKTDDNSEFIETLPIFKESMMQSQGLYEYAFFELLKSWGITPDYVAGEGIGEIVAAIAAGIITLDSGLKLIASQDHPDQQMQVARETSYRDPQLGFISSWTGQVIRKESLGADYWRPHATVKNIPDGTIILSAESNWKDLLQTMSQLYLNGIFVDWKVFDQSYERKKVQLPTYPFQREHYWIDEFKMHKKPRLPVDAHPLLGELISSPSDEKLFTNEIDINLLPYLKDHQVFDHILFPGAGFTELMLAAGHKLFKTQSFKLHHLIFEQPLALFLEQSTPIELVAKPKEKGYAAFIYSKKDQDWILHAKGELVSEVVTSPPKMDWEKLRAACKTSIDVEAFYNKLDSSCFHYGKKFQTLQKIWVGDNEVIAELTGESASALIDGSCQVLSVFIKEDGSVFLPYRMDHLTSFSELGSFIRIHGKLNDNTTMDIEIFSLDGKPLLKIQGFHTRKTDQVHLQNALAKQTGYKISSWFYQIAWQPKPLEKIEEMKHPWLIISEKEEEIAGLQSKTIKPEHAAKEIAENPSAGVLWFASGRDSLKYALTFVQTIALLETKPILYFITHGIQPIGPITDLENATFNGFYKTLKLEMPSLDCRHIDVAPNENFPIEELQANDKEGQVAYAQGIRYIPRLQSAKNLNHSSQQIKIDPLGSYLITGGLGGLGLKVAEWLAKQGAKHLVLVGRRVSQNIEIPNATVETLSVDISQKPAVDDLMQKFGRDWPELKGIIHSAGIIDDAILFSQDWGRFEKVFAPKVQGSWNLHEASQNKALDFFILFSSFASTLGSPGQINYASANAYLDALAFYRQQKGLPALSISWGAWAEVGLAAELTERHGASGLIAFKPEEGIQALELALTQTIPHLSIAHVDWRLVPFQLTFLNEMINTETIKEPTLLRRIKEALPSQRKELLTDYLQQILEKISGLSSLDPELGFFEAGMDSLMTEELHEKLQADIGKEYILPSTFVFDYPSINKIETYMLDLIYKKDKKNKFISKIELTTQKDATIEKEISNMSLDEVDKFLE